MQKKNCFTSMICAACFLFFFFQCRTLSESAAYWPKMICVAGLALSMLEIAMEGRKWYRTADGQEKLFPLNGKQIERSLLLLGLLILWVAGLTTIGFLVSSVLALCAISVCFEPIKTQKNILRDIAVCILFGLIIYFIFKYLGIHFPRALLM